MVDPLKDKMVDADAVAVVAAIRGQSRKWIRGQIRKADSARKDVVVDQIQREPADRNKLGDVRTRPVAAQAQFQRDKGQRRHRPSAKKFPVSSNAFSAVEEIIEPA